MACCCGPTMPASLTVGIGIASMCERALVHTSRERLNRAIWEVMTWRPDRHDDPRVHGPQAVGARERRRARAAQRPGAEADGTCPWTG